MVLFAYLSLYTWNQRTGFLDKFAANTGMEMTSWVLAPGEWVKTKAGGFWNRYMDLVGVRERNEQLRAALDQQSLELAQSREDAAEAIRLRRLLSIDPPPNWPTLGARVIAERLGPTAALDTLLLDKGFMAGIHEDAPVMVPDGVLGRVIKLSANAAQVLLLTDGNSRVAVLGQVSRTPGIIVGRGPGQDLEVLYVPQNARLEAGEILVTSGIAGIYPKGLPVARVLSATRSDLSLFQEASAACLVDMRRVEEALVLTRPGFDLTEGPTGGPADDPAWVDGQVGGEPGSLP